MTANEMSAAIHEGAVLRVRPKAMTVATIMAGLLPIMWGGGTGSEVMQRIAAPMIGGMVSAPLLSMLVIPAVYMLLHKKTVNNTKSQKYYHSPAFWFAGLRAFLLIPHNFSARPVRRKVKLIRYAPAAGELPALIGNTP